MPNEYCQNCGGKIQILINQGQAYCSENCKKALEKNGN